MSNNLKFYQCKKCGNIVGLVKEGGGTLTCCGEAMALMEANIVEASKEKHIPVAYEENGKLVVKVGSVAHPMEDKHYIEWIAVVSDNQTQRFILKPGDEPLIRACAIKSGTVYAYCNLHGLWKVNF